MLTKLSLNTRLDRSSRDVIELNVCENSEVPCFRCLIGRAVKTYNYINRVVLTLPLTVYEGTWTNTLPSRCYAITMILRVRRKILKLLRPPTYGVMTNLVLRATGPHLFIYVQVTGGRQP